MPNKTMTAQEAFNKGINAMSNTDTEANFSAAMKAIDNEDKIFASMSADELVELAKRGMEEISKLREADMTKMAEGRQHFTALIEQLSANEKDLYRRQIMYTAILSTVIDEEPETIDEHKLPRQAARLLDRKNDDV